MQCGCSPEEQDRVVQVIEGLGLAAERIPLGERVAVRAHGYREPPASDLFEALSGVELVLPVEHPPRRVGRQAQRGPTVIRCGKHEIGGGGATLIAGPCAVEDEGQMLGVAHAVARAGADILRGGAYKPRTSPYEFQGLGRPALALLARAGREAGLPVVTEAVDERSLELVAEYADLVQIGARNMQNFELLKRTGRIARPVLLKRGMAASFDDLLMAAEYVLDAGNSQVILCERGIRTFSNHSRYTLDLSVVPLLKRSVHLPVIVDPSHASGNRASVAPLARAALAAGADGVMLEVHPDPVHARCDGPQSLRPEEFAAVAATLRALASVLAHERETVL